MQLNYWLILATGIIPIIIGFLWYNPSVMGNKWMETVGITDESMKGANMLLIFILSYLFGCMLSLALHTAVIHQMGFTSSLEGDKTPEVASYIKTYFENYGNRFRTFKHGALHGTITALFIALPVIGVNALWNRKSAKFIFIHVGYWVVCMGLIGGVLCAFM
jgi:Protein of unknown function (DUF1761)